MKAEFLNEKLKALMEEGADVAVISSDILTENDRDEEARAEAEQNVAKLTETVAKLNKTNLELLDQIRNGASFSEDEDEDDGPKMTVEELFEMID